MLKIYNLEDKKEYLREVAILEHNEWGAKFFDNLSNGEKLYRFVEIK